MADEGGKEEMQRRLSQARRMSGEAYDELTKQRLSAMVAELEKQLAEVQDLDAPPE